MNRLAFSRAVPVGSSCLPGAVLHRKLANAWLAAFKTVLVFASLNGIVDVHDYTWDAQTSS